MCPELVIMENTNLIRCADHQLAPWAIVCIHVMDGKSDSAVAIPKEDGSEVMFDWVCPDCESIMEETNESGDIDHLAAVCIHCLRDHILPQYPVITADEDGEIRKKS